MSKIASVTVQAGMHPARKQQLARLAEEEGLSLRQYCGQLLADHAQRKIIESVGLSSPDTTTLAAAAPIVPKRRRI